MISVFTITGESLPVINNKEIEYYSSTLDIEKFVSVFTDISIIRDMDLSEDDNYYKRLLDENLKEYNIVKNKDGSMIIREEKDIITFPLIDYKNRYYNIVVKNEYITINELVKKGEFIESNMNYSDDNRVVNSINIER